MKQLPGVYKRIVIKIGSSLFFRSLHPAGINLDFNIIHKIVEQVIQLIKDGREVVIVSSGAIAQGIFLLKLSSRPKKLSYLQAAAAAGQSELMDVYRRFFKEKKLNCAQVLLTWEDFGDRKRYLNAKNTLLTLLKLKAVPIINENDTVATDEIKFGDNDRLSALVANLISADILVILSDVDGLLDKDGKTLVRIVPEINSRINELACPTDKQSCVGGMITKIEAAKIAVDSGIPCIIANGRREDILKRIVEEPVKSGIWTLFLPKKGFLAAKKSWIAFSAKAKGRIIIDEGARLALLNNKSLLSVGIMACEGNFLAGDIVGICDSKNFEFARGKVKISSKELDRVKGRHFEKEIVHRDDIVIL